MNAAAGDDPFSSRSDDMTTFAEGRTSLAELLAHHIIVRRIDRGPSEVLLLAPSGDPTNVSTVVKTEKQPRTGSGHEARALYCLHATLASTAPPTDGGRPVAPRPIGWGEDPTLFAYEYAEGVPVKERIESLALAGTRWTDELSDIGRGSGTLLARFHGAIERGESCGRGTNQAGRLPEVCRRVGIGSGPRPAGVVRSLCDSGPHNLIVRGDGDVQLIDLPTDERWTFAEFDLGVLSHRLARRAAIAFGSSASANDAHRVFTDPLCAAYIDAGQPVPDRSEVMAAFASSAFVFAKRSLTLGHPHASLGYARRDLRWGLASLWIARRGR